MAADRPYVHTANIADGTVYRGASGRSRSRPSCRAAGTAVPGPPGTTSHRLLVTGAFTGRFVVYTDTGNVVASYTVPDTGEPTLVNDETVTPDGDVYTTDSFRAVVHHNTAAEVNAPATGIHRTLEVACRLPDYVTDFGQVRSDVGRARSARTGS